MHVHIHGSTVAGLRCAPLLAAAGHTVSLRSTRRQRSRVVVIAAPTLDLFSHIWQLNIPDLVAYRALNERAVAWSTQTCERVPARALALDAAALQHGLQAQLDARVELLSDLDPEPRADWRILAHGKPDGPSTLRAGARVAVEASILAALPELAHASAIASVAAGWVFAVPHPDAGTTLTLVAAAPAAGATELLDAARQAWPEALRALELHDLMQLSVTTCAPRLALKCAEARQLRVGDAALQLDPLRGDGVGYGLRGALLACAVIDGDQTSERARELHFEQRLHAAFRQHVSDCCTHYREARHAEVWTAELNAMHEALACLEVPSEWRYQLRGRNLHVL